MAVKMIDIARQAGVSRSTVSLALSDASLKKYQVSPETVERVRRIAREMGYRPNRLGVALVSARTHTVGLLLGKVQNRASHGTEVDGVADGLGDDYTVFSALFGHRTAADQEQRALMAFADYRVDGIIALWSGLEENIPVYRDIVERYRIPLVLLQHQVPGVDAPVVAADYHASTFAAVSALHRLGHRRIALAYHSESRNLPLYSEDERNGYETAMDELGCGMQKKVFTPQQFGIDDRQEIYLADYCRALAEHLRQTRECTAIITVGDPLALALIERCRRQGMGIPGDLSVIGTGNFDYADSEQGDISSVDEHHEQIGRRAAQLLIKLVDGQPVEPKTWKIPVEVVLRGTVAAPR